MSTSRVSKAEPWRGWGADEACPVGSPPPVPPRPPPALLAFTHGALTPDPPCVLELQGLSQSAEP